MLASNRRLFFILLVCVGIAAAVAYWDKIKAKIPVLNTLMPALPGSQPGTPTTPGSTAPGSATPAAPGANMQPLAGTSVYVDYNKYPYLSARPDGDQQLKLGVKSSAVAVLQLLLNSFGNSLVYDGNFGPKTQAALYNKTRKYSMTLREFIRANIPQTSPAYLQLRQAQLI